MNTVIGENVKTSPAFSAVNYHDIDGQVTYIRSATVSAGPPTCFEQLVILHIQLEAVSLKDVIAFIASLLSKQCDYDPLATWLLKKNDRRC